MLGELRGEFGELARRGWANKAVAAKDGRVRSGKPFDRTTLYKLLTNVTYAGKVRYKDEAHDGEHPAVVHADGWRRVQAALGRNGRSGGGSARNRFWALLKRLLRCDPCGSAMAQSHTG